MNSYDKLINIKNEDGSDACIKYHIPFQDGIDNGDSVYQNVDIDGESFNFGGASSIKSTISLNSEFNIVIKFNQDVVGGSRTILEIKSDVNNDLIVIYASTTLLTIYCRFDGLGHNYTQPITTDITYNIIINNSDSGLTYFVDDINVLNYNHAVTPIMQNPTCAIGQTYSGSSGFVGRISFFALFNSSFSNKENKQMYIQLKEAPYEYFRLPFKAGDYDINYQNTNKLWIMPDGTETTDDKITGTLDEDGVITLRVEDYNSLKEQRMFRMYGAYTFTGKLSDLPYNDYYYYLHGFYLVEDDIKNLPTKYVRLFYLMNALKLTGSFADLPNGDANLYISNCPLLTGSFADFNYDHTQLILSTLHSLTGDWTDVNMPNLSVGLTLIDLPNITIIASDLPTNINTLILGSLPGFTGIMADIPYAPSYLKLDRLNITGAIGDLPSFTGETSYFFLQNLDNINGSLSDVYNCKKYMYVVNCPNVTGALPIMNAYKINLIGLPLIDINQTIINIEAANTSVAGSYIQATGTTPTVDLAICGDAITALEARGWLVNINRP